MEYSEKCMEELLDSIFGRIRSGTPEGEKWLEEKMKSMCPPACIEEPEDEERNK